MVADWGDSEAPVSSVRRWVFGPEGAFETTTDELVREEPLEIRVEGHPIAVVMRTPGADADLVRGFLLTEGIVGSVEDLVSIRECTRVPGPEAEGNVWLVRLRPDVPFDLQRFRRNMFAGSSCGICGKASLEQALRLAEPLPPATTPPWSPSTLLSLVPRMRRQQAIFERTGGLHAAAGFDDEGEIVCVAEDIGRHNAVDKVVGWAAQAKRPLAGLVVSGRISFEITQKALAARISTIVAVSAPSALAVELAQTSNMTLVAFSRGERMVVYASPHRVKTELPATGS